MTFLDNLDSLTNITLLYLANVAAASVITSCFTLFAIRFVFSNKLPTQHALLVAASLVILASPLVVALIALSRTSVIGVEISGRLDAPARNNPGNLITPPKDRAAAPVSSTKLLHAESHAAQQRPQVVAQSPASVDHPPANSPGAPDKEAGAKVSGPTGHENRIAAPAALDENRSQTNRGALRTLGVAFAIAWLFGSLLCAVALLRSWRRVRAFLRSNELVTDGRLNRLVRASAARFGLNRPPALYQSASIRAPVSIGALRCRIVVPSATIGNWTSDQWRSLIDHEMAHIARGDHWVGILQRLNRTLYWWNLPYRSVASKVSTLREKICDDLAVGDGEFNRRYADALVELAGHVAGAPKIDAALGVVGGAPSQLTVRVERLLSNQPRGDTRMGRRDVAGVVMFATLLLASLFGTTIHAAHVHAAQLAGDSPKQTIEESEKGESELQASLADAISKQQTVEAAERLALSTIARTPADADRGRVFAELARLCQRQNADARSLVWAQAALEHSLPIPTRLDMYQTWATSADKLNWSARGPESQSEPWNSLLPRTLAMMEASLPQRHPGRQNLEDEILGESIPSETKRRIAADLGGALARRFTEKQPDERRVDALAGALQQLTRYGVVTRNSEQLERSRWTQYNVAFSTEFFVDWSEANRFARMAFDIAIDQPGAWNDLMEGFSRDPYGPQVDVEKELIPALSGRVAVVTRFSTPHGPYGESVLVGIHATLAAELEALVARFMQADPDASAQREANGARVWSINRTRHEIPELEINRTQLQVATDADEHVSNHFACVAGSWLLLSADENLLRDSMFAIQPVAAGSTSTGSVGAQRDSQDAETGIGNAMQSVPDIESRVEPASEEEIEHLRQLVGSLNELYEIAKSNLAVGRGSSGDFAQVGVRFSLAKAKLAEAQGQMDNCLRHLQDAVNAAEDNVRAQRQLYDAGQETLSGLLEAQASRTETKLQRTRMQKRIEDEARSD